MNDLISIALATYNGEKYIKAQIDSILKQTISNFELIITDDNSTDNTIEILKGYEEKDKRVRVYKNNKRLGYPGNFEKAISLCNGKYIAYSDQDDVWTENHLELLYNEIISDEDLILVCANSELVDKKLNKLGITKRNDYYVSNDENEQFIQAMHQNYAQGCCLIFNEKIKKKLLPFPPQETYHDYWTLLVAVSLGKVRYINEIIDLYRQHDNNYAGAMKKDVVSMWKHIFQGKSKIANDMLVWLEPIQERNLLKKDSLKEKSFLQAYNYWKQLYKKTNKYKTFRYFIKNYNLIYFTTDKKLKILRLIKTIIGF